jgi:hypothetical protein
VIADMLDGEIAVFMKRKIDLGKVEELKQDL